jgi:hypothetical protein
MPHPAVGFLGRVMRPARPDPDDTAEIPVITDTAPPAPAPAQAGYAGMSNLEQLLIAWRYARKMAGDAGKREGSWWNEVVSEQQSIRAVREYAASRCWVPEGHDGGFAEHSVGLYFLLYGNPKATYHLLQAHKYARPTRVLYWMAFRNSLLIALLVTVAVLTGNARAWLAAWAVIAITLAPAGLAVLVLAATRSRPPATRPGRDHAQPGPGPDYDDDWQEQGQP